MSELTSRDLNAFHLDVHSWLGRAVMAGVESEGLSANFADVLMAFLRLRSLSFARGQRTGIALGKDKLRRGVEMGLSCIDLSLDAQSAGDLNRAVEILAVGDFSELYRRGWELAFARMEEMRERAALLNKRRQLVLFPQQRERVQALAGAVPETWTGVDAEGDLVELDPRVDWNLLVDIEGRVEFLRALPEEAFTALCASREVDFAHALRRIVLALALSRRDLSVDAEVVRAFDFACFADGVLLPKVKAAILEQIAAQLEEGAVEGDIARQIVEEIHEQVAAMERASARGWLEDLFLEADAVGEA